MLVLPASRPSSGRQAQCCDQPARGKAEKSGSLSTLGSYRHLADGTSSAMTIVPPPRGAFWHRMQAFRWGSRLRSRLTTVRAESCLRGIGARQESGAAQEVPEDRTSRRRSAGCGRPPGRRERDEGASSARRERSKALRPARGENFAASATRLASGTIPRPHQTTSSGQRRGSCASGGTPRPASSADPPSCKFMAKRAGLHASSMHGLADALAREDIPPGSKGSHSTLPSTRPREGDRPATDRRASPPTHGRSGSRDDVAPHRRR